MKSTAMGRKIGYARVSTDEQNLDLQIQALKSVGCEVIYTDKGISGGTRQRPGLNKALKALRKGDKLVVWRLDRLGRSLVHLVQMLDALGERKVRFHSMCEAIDTSSSGGRLVFHMMAALAEFERTLISERTRAGMAAARARGQHVGRFPSLSHEQCVNAQALLDEGLSPESVSDHFNVTQRTLQRLIRRMRESQLSCCMDANTAEVVLSSVPELAANSTDTQASLPPEAPGHATAADDGRSLRSQPRLDDRPPGHETEPDAIVEHGEAPACELDAASVSATDALPIDDRPMDEPCLACDLPAGGLQFAPAQRGQQATCDHGALALTLGQPLTLQQVDPELERLLNLAAETQARQPAAAADQLLVQLGDTDRAGLPLDGQMRLEVHRDATLQMLQIVLTTPFGQIMRYLPQPLGQPLHDPGAAQGFELAQLSGDGLAPTILALLPTCRWAVKSVDSPLSDGTVEGVSAG